MAIQILTWLGKRLRIGGRSATLDITKVQAGSSSSGSSSSTPSVTDTMSSSRVTVSASDTAFSFSLSPSVSTFSHYEYYVQGYSSLKTTTTANSITIDSVINRFGLTAPDNSTQNYTLYVRAVSTQGNTTNYATKSFTVTGAITVNVFKTNAFNPVEDVIVSAEPNNGDRVIIVCRHSERTSVSGGSGTLTSQGGQWAQNNGSRIKAKCQAAGKFTNTSNDYYASTTVPRTRQTAYFIGMGRGYSSYNNSSYNGSSNPSNFANPSCIGAYDLISNIGGMQNGGDIDWLALSNLTDDHFSEVKARVDSKVPDIISTTAGHPFSVLVTHDLFMVPMIEVMFPDIQFDRQKATDIHTADSNGYYTVSTGRAAGSSDTGKGTNYGKWCGYMSGVCFIVHSDGTYDAWPVEGLDSTEEAQGTVTNACECKDGFYIGYQN